VYILLFSLWLIFHAKITLEIVLFGLFFSGILFYFTVKFMDYSLKKEKQVLFLCLYIFQYVVVLIVEILRANIGAIKFIFRRKQKPRPFIFKFRTALSTQTARVVLANSITLTPGTITVSLDQEVFTIHCLDISLAEGMQNSILVQLLKRMEGVIGL